MRKSMWITVGLCLSTAVVIIRELRREVSWPLPRETKERPHIHFTGTGALMMYSCGMLGYIQRHFDLSDVRCSSQSGGGIAALCCVHEIDASSIMDRWLLPVIAKVKTEQCSVPRWRRFTFPSFYKLGNEHLRSLLTPDSHMKVGGRLFVSVTALPWRAVWISRFDGPADITNAINASMHIPFLSIRPFYIFRAQRVCDGCLSALRPPACFQRYAQVSPFGEVGLLCGLTNLANVLDPRFHRAQYALGYAAAKARHGHFVECGLIPLNTA